MGDQISTSSASVNELTIWYDYIAAALGRKPRGLAAIAVWNECGKPAVIRVASVVDEKPFPTMFWLIDPDISLQIDRLESAGAIASLQRQVDDSEALRADMLLNHQRHRAMRASFLTVEERQYLTSKGMMSAIDSRGIGGITDMGRIRCLHAWYAAHLVEFNAIGRFVDELLPETLIYKPLKARTEDHVSSDRRHSH